MKILIISKKNDVHSSIVDWGLRRFGFEPVIWKWDDFPSKDKVSYSLNTLGQSVVEIETPDKLISTPFDVIWNRRHGLPTPFPESHPNDIKTIEAESREFIKNVFHFLGNDQTFWINTPSSASHANNKALQLVTAQALGFKIPDTLLSNNPEKVRRFFDRHHGKIIFKGFLPNVWNEFEMPQVALRTSVVEAKHLIEDFCIRACPGIFQNAIQKDYEIRVTVMGEKILAAAISHKNMKEVTDFRYDLDSSNLLVAEITLPDAIEKCCISLCKKLGLVFACIDLILSKDGEYVFLEVNEAGQFLWKEANAPTLLMLDTFCRFISKQELNNKSPNPTILHLNDWIDTNSYKAMRAATEPL